MNVLSTVALFHIYKHCFCFAQGTKRNETVAFDLILFYNYIVEITGNFKSRGGECVAPFGVDRIFICVDCHTKHKKVVRAALR